MSHGARAGATVLWAMAWMALGGLFLSTMNALMRASMAEVAPFQAQFVRYAFGTLLMLPWMMRARGPGLRLPSALGGQLWRGLAQTGALALFFLALPHLPLADATAILFTTPIVVLAGAALLLRERVTPARWIAACVGFVGVVIVVGPHFGQGGAGWWSIVMLASTPLFAAAFLITKVMTGRDDNQTIVFWQNVFVSAMTLPLAIPVWGPMSGGQWALLAFCGVLGTAAHLCFTVALSRADISAVQPMRFLDLLWASLLGIVMFGNTPALSALGGGAIILAATVWLARRESAGRARSRAA